MQSVSWVIETCLPNFAMETWHLAGIEFQSACFDADRLQLFLADLNPGLFLALSLRTRNILIETMAGYHSAPGVNLRLPRSVLAGMITCYLRYRIDMYKLAEFEAYARLWVPLVERFDGIHHGYFLPHESQSDLAVALFSFPSLAEYENYRLNALSDPDCQAAYAYAQETRCILRYERQFLRPLSDSAQ